MKNYLEIAEQAEAQLDKAETYEDGYDIAKWAIPDLCEAVRHLHKHLDVSEEQVLNLFKERDALIIENEKLKKNERIQGGCYCTATVLPNGEKS